MLVYQRLVPPKHRNDLLLVSVDRNARNALPETRPVASPSAWKFLCGLDLALDLAPRRASASVWPDWPKKICQISWKLRGKMKETMVCSNQDHLNISKYNINITYHIAFLLVNVEFWYYFPK
jgi:hypothetical protein